MSGEGLLRLHVWDHIDLLEVMGCGPKRCWEPAWKPVWVVDG